MPRPSPRPETGLRPELFPHGADVGVRGIGASVEEAFEAAALALTSAVTAPEAVRPVETVAIEASAPDLELLLVKWLNAIVFEMATRSMLFGAYRVRISGGRLVGEAEGEPVDDARHAPAVEIKGATLTALRVSRDPDGLWRAECVLDV